MHWRGNIGSALREVFAQRGIAPERIEFVGFLPIEQYFSTYAKIDVALDPFPYPGGTTTCDALWMGVPVVSLSGKTAVSRGGTSILNQIGMPDLVTRSDNEYIHRAITLSNDLTNLQAIRSSLRQRMRASPLMDAEAFARCRKCLFENVEELVRWS